jgi:hypothetical protein
MVIYKHKLMWISIMEVVWPTQRMDENKEGKRDVPRTLWAPVPAI